MKKLYILIGCSGSGKSTLAKKTAEQIRKEYGCLVYIHSTDNYFVDVHGNYKFDPSKLGYYHKCNQMDVAASMQWNASFIIVDNTNLTKKERKPYTDLAAQYGYEVEYLYPDTPWVNNAEELAKRNTHGVPLESIKRMLARLERHDE